MTTGVCSRCGKKGEVEYGADGLPYCSDCIFYGMYKQCSRCKMYIPITELQQYKGNWICPNCLLEERQREEEETKPKKEKKELTTSPISYQNVCERCGREAEVFYIFNGKRLCESCLKEEQEKAILKGRKPFASPTKVVISKRKSFFQKIIDAILAFLGFKKKEGAEIIALENNKTGKKKISKEPLIEKKPNKNIVAEVLPEKKMRGRKDSFGKFKKE